MATQTWVASAAMAPGALNWYLGPVSTRMGAPVVASSSVTEPPPMLVTHRRVPVGTDQVTATYSGDASYAAADSAATVTVILAT